MQKKKSFRSVDHPAAAFISSNEPINEGYTGSSEINRSLLHESREEYNTSGNRPKGASGRKENETKSKRLNLLIRPSLMNDFMKVAYMRRTSINDLINRLVDDCVTKDASLIDEYDRLFRDKPQS
ncbi:MAG: hypothetical protein HGA62_03910 [Chlorobiaceae bacterium]|nr:hypothetical protein [Chlorobiaceae bacterium]NTV61450.1 hypothetical protein [Chlorobiaceae bacterium]